MQLSFTSSEQELERLRRESKDIENVCYFITWLVTCGLIFSIKGCLKICVLRFLLSNDAVVILLRISRVAFKVNKCYVHVITFRCGGASWKEILTVLTFPSLLYCQLRREREHLEMELEKAELERSTYVTEVREVLNHTTFSTLLLNLNEVYSIDSIFVEVVCGRTSK